MPDPIPFLRIVPPVPAQRDDALDLAVAKCVAVAGRVPAIRAAAPKNKTVQDLAADLDGRLKVITGLVRKGARGPHHDLALRHRLENALNDFIALRQIIPQLRRQAAEDKNKSLRILVDWIDKTLCQVNDLLGASWAANELIDHEGEKEGVA